MYPFSALEGHLDRRVDREDFQLFHPSEEDLRRAEELFTPSARHDILYTSSAVRMDHVPVTQQPEVCVCVCVCVCERESE